MPQLTLDEKIKLISTLSSAANSAHLCGETDLATELLDRARVITHELWGKPAAQPGTAEAPGYVESVMSEDTSPKISAAIVDSDMPAFRRLIDEHRRATGKGAEVLLQSFAAFSRSWRACLKEVWLDRHGRGLAEPLIDFQELLRQLDHEIEAIRKVREAIDSAGPRGGQGAA